MARRRSDDVVSALWELFSVAPWWVCPIVALVLYAVLAYVIPSQIDDRPFSEGVANLSRQFALYIGISVLFLGLAAASRRWLGGRLLDQQTGADSIRNLSWQQFEELVAAAYRRQGYGVLETGGGGADGGIDLVMVRDGQKTLVQCKHWRSGRVGVNLVRELHGLTHSKEHSGSRGIFVTFGRYTPDAVRFARENGIELVGHAELMAIVRSAQHAAAENTVSPRDESATPSCPQCGKAMIKRTARRGSQAGRDFWGCSAYPSCKGTRAC